MLEKKSFKSNTSVKETIRVEPVSFINHPGVISRPITTFTSVPIKLIKYHLSKPFNSRAKFLETFQKSTIICYRCKKLKPNTFLKESQVSTNKICDCMHQIHSIKIQKPQEKKIIKQKSSTYECAPLFAEGRSINSSPNKIKRFYSEIESQRSIGEGVFLSTISKSNDFSRDVPKLKYLVFKGNNSELIKEAMKRRPHWNEGYYSITSTVNFIWQPTSHGIKFDRLKSFLPAQITNHFEYHAELSNKMNLYKNLEKYASENEFSVHNITPITFLLEKKSAGFRQAIESFKEFFISIGTADLENSLYCGKNIWILKPASFNRGRGIQIFDDFSNFEETLGTFDENSKYIIQKYIEKPLLFNHRKFDIRMWVLITHENNCYYFPQGYIRTSSENYSISSNLLANKFVHLTNNAIQKESNGYGKFEKGNQVSFEEFEKYVDLNYGPGTFEKIYEKIKDLILISLRAVKNKLNPKARQFCFEIFGYDFIVDSELKPWIIEVNTNPCLELSSPLLAQLIPRMIEDALELTVDTVFRVEKEELVSEKVIQFKEDNLWEFILKI